MPVFSNSFKMDSVKPRMGEIIPRNPSWIFNPTVSEGKMVLLREYVNNEKFFMQCRYHRQFY